VYESACLCLCLDVRLVYACVVNSTSPPALCLMHTCANFYICIPFFPCVFVSSCIRSSVCGLEVNGPVQVPSMAVNGMGGGLLPQSILMLIYQTLSLPRHTTLAMFPGPWGAINCVEPSCARWNGGSFKNNTHTYTVCSLADFFSYTTWHQTPKQPHKILMWT